MPKNADQTPPTTPTDEANGHLDDDFRSTLHLEPSNTVQVVDAPIVDDPIADELLPADVPEDPREAIAKRFSEQRNAELGVPTEDVPQPEALADGLGDGNGDVDTEWVTVKVNGREKQVEKSRVDAAGGIDAYQKNAAASELLNQAAAERRAIQVRADELARREREIAEREARATQQVATPPATTKQPTDLKATAQRYHDALLDGRLDEASEIFLELQSGTQNAIPADEVARRAAEQAEQRIVERQQRERAVEAEKDRLKAVEQFSERFPKIASDPMLVTLTDRTTLQVRQEHPEWSPSKIIDEAASRVLKWAGERNGAPSAGNAAGKRGMSPPVRGGSARVANRPAPPPQTGSQYVANLRKARGLE